MLTDQELANQKRVEEELKFLRENPWYDQYRRIKRFYKFTLSSLENTDINASDKVDRLLSFFTFCYHLADWLINSGVDEHEVRSFIKGSVELSLCRNLCLGIKHLKINSPGTPKVADISSSGIFTPIAQIYDPSGKPGKFGLLYEDGIFDVEQLMKSCLDQWTTFLLNKQLLLNTNKIRTKIKFKLKNK